MTDREVMQQALEALDSDDPSIQLRAALALRTALEQPAQEPVVFKIYLPKAPRQDVNYGMLPWVYDQDPSSGNVASMWVTPFKATPPQRPWVALTDEEKKHIATAAGCTEDDDGHIVTEIFRLAEAKLKEKNT